MMDYDTHREQMPIKRPGLLFIAIVAVFALGVAVDGPEAAIEAVLVGMSIGVGVSAAILIPLFWWLRND